MFRSDQSTLPELGDVELISTGLTLIPAISVVEQCHLVSGVFWMEFDLCNIPVKSCLCIYLHLNECEHNIYTGFKDWCACINCFLMCSNLSFFFLVPTSINDMYLKIEFG